MLRRGCWLVLVSHCETFGLVCAFLVSCPGGGVLFLLQGPAGASHLGDTMTTTTTHVARNVALAASGWAGVSTVKSNHIRGIRTMAVTTHNTCAACGEPLTGEINLCHIVGAEHGKGVADHNTYVGHVTCNDFDREVCEGDPFRILASMARPDLIIASVPRRGVALAAHEAYVAREGAAKERRAYARHAAMVENGDMYAGA